MNRKNYEKCFQELEWSINALKSVSEDIIPEVLDILNGKTKIIEGCPSKESQAELIFRSLKKKFRSVYFMVEECDRIIFDKAMLKKDISREEKDEKSSC